MSQSMVRCLSFQKDADAKPGSRILLLLNDSLRQEPKPVMKTAGFYTPQPVQEHPFGQIKLTKVPLSEGNTAHSAAK